MRDRGEGVEDEQGPPEFLRNDPGGWMLDHVERLHSQLQQDLAQILDDEPDRLPDFPLPQ